MFEAGTRLSFVGQDGKTHIGVVVSCNRRGTSCTVDVEGGVQGVGDRVVINANKPDVRVLPAPADEGKDAAAAGGRGEDDEAEAADEDGGADEDADEDDGDGDADADAGGAAQPDAFADAPEDVRSALDEIAATAAQPTRYLTADDGLSATARAVAAALHAAGGAALRADKLGIAAADAAGAQPVLYVEGFDAEQIWLQLDAQTEAAFKRTRRLMKKVGDSPSMIQPEDEAAIDALLADHGLAEDDGEASGSGSEGGADGEEGGEAEDEEEGDDDDEDMLLHEDSDDEEDGDDEEGHVKKRRKKESAELRPTEDAFLKLDDMEKFLQDAEAAEDKSDEDMMGLGDDDEEESDGEEGGGFAEGEVDSEEDEALAGLIEEATGKKGKLKGGDQIRYEDMFGSGPPDEDGPSADEHDADEDDADEDGPSGADSDEDDSDGDGFGGADGDKSTHELRQEKVARKAMELEEENIGERDWHLRGEAQGRHRPENSALGVDMDFERTVKPPPVPTEESTADLEEMIIKRIAAQHFDDPVRISVGGTTKERKTVDLDEDKAKEGLGDLYAADYVRAQVGGVADDKDEAVRVKARALFAALSTQLDALSNFTFAPKPHVEEVEIKVDVPAIAMEEAVPLAVASGSVRAPEEVYKAEASGDVRAETELTREERKARRARKKAGKKKQKAAKEADERTRARAAGGADVVAGRKSEAALRAPKPKHGKSEFSTSGAVFKKLAEEQKLGGARAIADAKAKADKEAERKAKRSAQLKL